MRLRRRPPMVSNAGRRRRQASGSPQSPSGGFAYRSRRSDQEANTGRQIPREQPHTRTVSLGRLVLRRFGLFLLLAALVISSINVLSLSGNARVVTLPGSNTSPFLRDKTVYQAAASRLLEDSIWNRNKITVNTDMVSRRMLTEFPELSGVNITVPLLSKRPVVYLQTAQAALILAAGNGSFVIDATGKALLAADNLSKQDKAELPMVTDQSGLRADLNHQVLSSDDVNFIRVILAELSARRVESSSLVLPRETSELDVRIKGSPYLVKFNLEADDARQQAGTYLAVKADLERKHVTPSQYVDVRVDGRAYYK